MRSSDWSSDVCSSDLTKSSAYSGDSWVAQTIALPNNVAPNAPVLTAPADGSTIDRNITQRFALTASAPEPGDSTSQTYWRHRPEESSVGNRCVSAGRSAGGPNNQKKKT